MHLENFQPDDKKTIVLATGDIDSLEVDVFVYHLLHGLLGKFELKGTGKNYWSTLINEAISTMGPLIVEQQVTLKMSPKETEEDRLHRAGAWLFENEKEMKHLDKSHLLKLVRACHESFTLTRDLSRVDFSLARSLARHCIKSQYQVSGATIELLDLGKSGGLLGQNIKEMCQVFLLVLDGEQGLAHNLKPVLRDLWQATPDFKLQCIFLIVCFKRPDLDLVRNLVKSVKQKIPPHIKVKGFLVQNPDYFDVQFLKKEIEYHTILQLKR